jgi:uncharacterized protein YndB with AHSA1/START domain
VFDDVEPKLVIQHWIAATPDEVWNAFVTPELFHQFFSPEGLHIGGDRRRGSPTPQGTIAGLLPHG